ncbi:MAG TPA: hypothetical protein VGW40_03910 [Allosphingosinicella sp.]|nr:hypothetical protein [Allosphingosinicella sp.]
MRFLFLAAALAALPASAQQPGVAVPGTPAPAADPRVNQVIVYGSDPCPASTDEEITVCARLPDEDRYRIPPNLRENPNAPANQAWLNRAIELSYVGRSGTDSCSTAGAGGFTGCMSQMINQARAERRGAGDVNWTRMVEEARQEREARLRAATQEEEEAERNSSSPN